MEDKNSGICRSKYTVTIGFGCLFVVCLPVLFVVCLLYVLLVVCCLFGCLVAV